MRIGIIASIWISNPPKNFGFGAQEYLTYSLAENLKKKGHEVTLFASGDSKTNARLVSVTDTQIEDINFPDQKIKDMFELMNLSEAYKMADQFDVFHNHLLPYGLVFSQMSKTPTVHTLHHAIYRTRADIFLYERYKKERFISISDTQRAIIPELNYIKTVYNGIDTATYTFKDKPDDSYLLYIGRMKRYKGIHEAIAIAKQLKIQLHIAAPLPHPSQADFAEVNEYWEHDIKPHIGTHMEYVGEIAGDKKIALLQNAKALLFPVEREEPFGMTLIEAMACGTPVVAYANGAVTEIVTDGKTGYLVNESTEKNHGNWTVTQTGMDGLIEAVQKVYALSPDEYSMMRKASRVHVEKSFTIEKMADSYEAEYARLLT